MADRNTARFLPRCRRAEELLHPHGSEARRPYEVVSVVTLADTDYRQFTEDLLRAWMFLEPLWKTCEDGDVVRCVLVRTRAGGDGILVVPEGPFVKLAAWVNME